MGMERLKSMKNCLMAQAEAQMSHLECVDAKELGEVIDMVKDLEEAMYYCSIVEAMEGANEENPVNNYYYMESPSSYYDKGNSSHTMYYTERPMNLSRSDNGRYMDSGKEGRSPMYRKMYMESKEMHHDTAKQLNDLENYLKELSSDITDMIRDASPEEKQLLHRKIAALATKIEQS